MAVNKNFVVKNGLEVNTNLILADAATDKVGIGTTVPGYTLDVAGGIGATSVYVAGFSTFISDVKIGSAQTTLTAIGNSVGVGTDTPSYLLDIRSAVSTGSTSLYVKGDARITGKLDVAGDITYDEVTGRNLYITGLSTFVGLSSAQEVRVGAGLSVVGVSTFHSNITVAGLSTFTGISTFGSAVHVGGALDVIGISTFKGNIDANGALDVDGHTELDDVNVSGASTFAGAADFNGAVDIDGHTELDDLNVSGIATLGSANIVAAGGTFQVGAGGTVLYVDTSGTLTIGSATTLATVSLNGGSIPSIGLVIALGG